MTTAGNPEQPQGINRRRVALALTGLPLFFVLFMFLPAGTWAWAKGWLFIVALVGIITGVFLCLRRVNPEVLVARSHTHEGTKRWDRILL
jgi:Ca2+/H+ antiporter